MRVAVGRDVEVEVVDDGRGAAAACDGHGLGLVGMRERAAVHGGTLDAGPATGGGFAVSARLPAVSEPIRVFLVDDQQMVRAGFRMLVESQDDMVVVGEAGDGGEALERLRRHRRRRRADGRPDAAASTASRRPGGCSRRPTPPRVIVLTTFDLDEYAFAAIRAGASAFLLKDAAPPDLLGAIRAVTAGDAVVAPSTTRRLLDHFAALPDPGAPATADDRLAAAHRARGRGADPHRPRALTNTEIADRPRRRRDDREDPRRPDPGQDRLPRPRPARRPRLRVGPRHALTPAV